MNENTSPAVPRSVEWMLRIGVAMVFVGHGMLGFGKPLPWVSYFGVVGIGHDTAYALMPWVGALDVSMALLTLLVPVRSAILYMAAWSVWTALLRPLAGESFWEVVERAGNYGAPWALFLLLKGSLREGGFRVRFAEVPEGRRRREICWVLRLTTAALLLGHGALGLLVRKPLLAAHYASIGLQGGALEPWVGAFEVLLALAVLLRPDYRLLLFVFGWKLATELLSPMAGSSFWVFIEHGGSYAAPLALAFLGKAWRERAAGVVAPSLQPA